jgi:hypothetical protein
MSLRPPPVKPRHSSENCRTAREVPGTVVFVGNFTHPPNRDSAQWLAREIMPTVKARHDPARLRIGNDPPFSVAEDAEGIAARWAARLEAICEEVRDRQPEEARG